MGQTGRPSGLPARDLCQYFGPGCLPKVTRIRSCPACWAMYKGQVSGPVSKKASGGPPPRRISVFLLEDHEVVRRGVRVLLEAEPDIEVIDEASTVSSALAKIPALRPDVAVLDVRLPDGDGVSVCREVRLRVPEVACLMLTAFSDDEALLDSIMAGAAGYVLKEIRGSDLVDAVRLVASGQSMLDPRAASKAMARLRDGVNGLDRLCELSARERKVLELIGEGLTNRQIGERMSVAEKTVKNYVSMLFVKLGMEQRTQAAVYAARCLRWSNVRVDAGHEDHQREAP